MLEETLFSNNWTMERNEHSTYVTGESFYIFQMKHNL